MTFTHHFIRSICVVFLYATLQIVAQTQESGHTTPHQRSSVAQQHHTSALSHNNDDIPLGAVFMLLSDWRNLRPGRKCHFNASMDAMSSKWRQHNPYPIILMDTKPWERRDMVDIRRTWFTLDFKFVNIGRVWESAPHIPESEFEDIASPTSNLNYKRMCHFFFKGFTEVPLLMEYRYLMRIDDDTCLLDHINFDIFARLQQKRAAYAYSHTWYDGDAVTKGMYPFVDKYVAGHHLTWKNEILHNKTVTAGGFPSSVPCFNTNFEVINTVRYREPAVMKFVDTVVASNMIFHRRWGDAPLRFVTAMLHWTEREMVRLEGFEVQHSAWAVFPMTEHFDSGNPL